ncbi:MAG: AAA family ATPase [Thermomicrobiales bacterium]
MSFDDIVAGLRAPDAYPWQPDAVEVINTHISWIFLAENRVLKLKRPVDYGFVDYSTRELRRTACEDEVRLNRRLSRGVYLGVVTINKVTDRIRVDGEGEPLEWATLMRRLPATGMLDQMLSRGEVDQEIVERISARLTSFHQRAAEPCAGESGSTARQAKVVLDNLVDLEPFAGNPLPAVQLRTVVDAMRSFCHEAKALLADRVAQGWIREGHGDLRTDHICLDEHGEIQIFDCVEFNKNIRCADVASDLAFLLVDLDRLGAPQIAADITQRYLSTEIDLPNPLLRFYRGHRALVKVKVACLSWRDLPAEQRATFYAEAMTYLDLAMATTTTMRPVIIAMSGMSGTGKSVVSSALARSLGATVISTDEMRRDGGAPEDAPTGWQTDRYAPAQRAAIYTQILDRARDTAQAGKPVILDATFLESDRRLEAAAAAKDLGVPLVFVETAAEEEIVRRRLTERASESSSVSEATVEIYERQRQTSSQSPPLVPPSASLVGVDTTTDGPVNVDAVYAVLMERGVLRPGIAVT